MILTIVNWLLESIRWKKLLTPIEKISTKQAFFSVIAGLSSGIWTPGRVGEFLGRMLLLPSEKRILFPLAWAIGSFIQWLVTFSIGFFSILFIANCQVNHKSIINIIAETYQETYYLFIIILMSLIFSVILLISLGAFKSLKFKSKSFDFIQIVKSYHVTSIFQIISLSFARYMIFSIQFLLAISLWHNSFSPFCLLLINSFMFWIATLIPSFSFTEPTAKTFILTTLFPDFFSIGSELILSSYIVWVSNIAIPSIIGSIVLLVFSSRSSS